MKPDKVLMVIPVLWADWECDGTAWIKEKSDGGRYLVMTNHGGEYVADIAELLERVKEYERVLCATRQAIELLK